MILVKEESFRWDRDMNLNNIAAERCASSEWLPRWTHLEHRCRYDFSAGYVEGKNVVDCASGSGFSSFLFASSGARNVIGVDVSQDAVEMSRAEYRRDNLKFLHGDGARLPIEDGWADVFVSLETIEHVENDSAYVSEMARVLKPDGLLLCSTPNREVTNPASLITDQPWNPHHRREYSREEFLRLFEKDFVVDQLFGQNPVAPWRVLTMDKLAKTFGKSLAVRLNQLVKCRWFIVDKMENHVVGRIDNFEPEYFLLAARYRK